MINLSSYLSVIQGHFLPTIGRHSIAEENLTMPDYDSFAVAIIENNITYHYMDVCIESFQYRAICF